MRRCRSTRSMTPEPGWDFLFVEARTAGGDDWTTLEEQNGFTTQDIGACPGFLVDNPFLDHYLTPILIDAGDPGIRTTTSTPAIPAGRRANGGPRPAMASTGSRGRSICRTREPIRSTSRFRSPTRATPSSSSAAWRSTTSSCRRARARRHSRTTAISSTAGSPRIRPTGSGPNENTWDVFAIVEPPPPPPEPPLVEPTDGAQMLFSDVADNSLQAPDARRSTCHRAARCCRSTPSMTPKQALDFLFVEARTAGGDDWTTLEEQNGFTNQNVGACPGIIDANPFLDHYLTPVLGPGRPGGSRGRLLHL